LKSKPKAGQTVILLISKNQCYFCNQFIFPLPIDRNKQMSENKKQRLLDQRYLKMADIWAQNSYCKRRQVGALIVKDKMIISDGYNGTPSGFENVCEDEQNITKPYVLHAEANAITKVAKSGNSSDGATLYVTSSPCLECSKLIIQAGIKRVVFTENYRVEDGINLLRRANIDIKQVDI
jgi:dCMP deaminase